MPKTVKPLKATYYNPAIFKDYSRLVSPPYDVINKDKLKSLRKKSPYNYSRVLLADRGDYKQVAVRLKKWLDSQILVDDQSESFYIYEQTFKVEGKTFRRFGVFSLLRMDKKGIFPHEHTLSAPKKDRKAIIESTKANLGPIFVIATKELNKLKKVYNNCRQQKPLFKCQDSFTGLNKVWKISDKRQVASICQDISNSKIVIADGHHRFETSFNYFKNNKDKFKDLNYVLAYITPPQEGLVILPTHRVLAANKSTALIPDKLKKYFRIEKISKSGLDKKLKSRGPFCLGLYHQDKFLFLELKDERLLDRIPNKLFRQLDTYIFHKLILPMFKLDGAIEYTHSLAEAKKMAGKTKIGFLLRAVPLETVLKISRKGFKFPQKSTYFYPKILSGLLIRRFGV
ncbi:MAG: DUF1015 domain-containing protein [Candidatus Omnitrophica bacterium]|nr:DUF1015 domain-containing protein [Candidatus Omnitrophota bacterium]